MRIAYGQVVTGCWCLEYAATACHLSNFTADLKYMPEGLFFPIRSCYYLYSARNLDTFVAYLRTYLCFWPVTK